MLFYYNGGLELLCESMKIHNVNVDLEAGEEKLTMKNLLSWVRTNLIKERPEIFIKGDSVRPGVLVLVNDCDWELSGQLDTTLEEKDVISIVASWQFRRAFSGVRYDVIAQMDAVA
ncbi:Ubiquitin-related modifier 1-like protein [Thalictrum thalictroides]|uniref:Ubiquitin-related modifier 1 homolog n=1 Tax=Thalictrum thalictroides TaxID=46969 RepID=A0A7J6X7W5_THATH|nr:Ubiquitin-related modifier 1-like protein [Thalictrum thalictroides]